MTAPTPEALRHRAAARRWALALLIAFTSASVAGNVVVVVRRGLAPEDIALAALAPVVLAGMAHLLAKFVQSGLPASGIGRGVYGAGIGAVSLIGAGAFILSFENLAALAARQHNWFVAGVFPLTLDLAIVVSTGVHVVIGRANEHDQNNGVQPYVSWWARFTARTSGAATRTPGAPAAVHQGADQEPRHAAAAPTADARHDADHHGDAPSSDASAPLTLTSDDAVTRHGDAVGGDAADAPAVTRPGPAAPRDGDATDATSDDAVTQPLALPGDADRGARGAPVTRSSDADRDATVARRLTSVPTAPAGDADAELILRLIEQGASGTDAAEALGVSKSTALRRMRQVKELAEASA